MWSSTLLTEFGTTQPEAAMAETAVREIESTLRARLSQLSSREDALKELKQRLAAHNPLEISAGDEETGDSPRAAPTTGLTQSSLRTRHTTTPPRSRNQHSRSESPTSFSLSRHQSFCFPAGKGNARVMLACTGYESGAAKLSKPLSAEPEVVLCNEPHVRVPVPALSSASNTFGFAMPPYTACDEREDLRTTAHSLTGSVAEDAMDRTTSPLRIRHQSSITSSYSSASYTSHAVHAALLDAETTSHAADCAAHSAFVQGLSSLYAVTNVGKRLRLGDEAFRRLLREVCCMPAFLGLPLFQRMVEMSIVRESNIALLVTAVETAQARVSSLRADLSYRREHSRRGTAMEDCTEPPTPITLTAALLTSIPPRMIGHDDDAQREDRVSASEERRRLLVPLCRADAASARLLDRIRSSLRTRVLARSISLTDWVDVWGHTDFGTTSGDGVGDGDAPGSSPLTSRAARLMLLVTSSPDPVLVHSCLTHRTELKMELRARSGSCDATRLPSPVLGSEPSPAPGGSGPKGHSSLSQTLRDLSPEEGAGSGGGPVFSTVLTAWSRLGARLRAATPALAPALPSSPSTSASRRFMYPVQHAIRRVTANCPPITRADLAPIVESLIERHPDLAGLRGPSMTRVRTRYIAHTTVRLLAGASRVGSCAPGSVGTWDFLHSTMADCVWATATSSILTHPTFAYRAFCGLNSLWDEAVHEETTACTDRTATSTSALSNAGSFGTARSGGAVTARSRGRPYSPKNTQAQASAQSWPEVAGTAASAVRSMLRRLYPTPAPTVSAGSTAVRTRRLGPNMGLTVLTTHATTPSLGQATVPLPSPATVAAVKHRRRSLELAERVASTMATLSSTSTTSEHAVTCAAAAIPPLQDSVKLLTPLPMPSIEDPDPDNEDAACIGYTSARTFLARVLGPASSCSGSASSDVAGSGVNLLLLSRICEGVPRPLASGTPGKLSFDDICWLLAAHADCMQGSSVSYWMRCLDGDGDGIVGIQDIAQAATARYGHGISCLDAYHAQYSSLEAWHADREVAQANVAYTHEMAHAQAMAVEVAAVVPLAMPIVGRTPQSAPLPVRAAVWETSEQLVDLFPGSIAQCGAVAMTEWKVRKTRTGAHVFDLLVAPAAALTTRNNRPVPRAPGSPTGGESVPWAH